MLNPLHTNRITVVRVFDWACGNIVRSLACNVWYVLATLGTTYTHLIAVVVCSSRNTMACLRKNLLSSNYIYGTVYQKQLVLDEKAQSDSYIIRTA